MADFSKAIQSAQKVAAEESGSSFKYKIVYPSEGTLTIRLLYNVKSGLIVRKILRHTVGENKIPCMQMYGYKKDDCPICATLKSIEAANNQVPSGSWAKPRFIAYAQYIRSTYKIDNLKEGDVFILMGPKTLYEGIQNFISNISANVKNLEECFMNYESNTMTVTRDHDNTYQFMINPYDKYKSADSQEAFDKLLDNVDDLSHTVVSAEPTDEINKQVKAAAEELRKKYLDGRVIMPDAAPVVPQEPTTVSNVAAQQVVTTPAVEAVPPQQAVQQPTAHASAPAPQAPISNKRKCYGDYKRIQETDDPMCRALRALCPNCPDASDCKLASEVKS